ncbi:hypothetical protein [Streptomyces exfoliatus]|uniref:hypothetical protein n=1 Tax=Streptomyces exfoliatus TaxID=1905 RepID=UPI0004C7919A|nr:hypothetical protein [Streptomyces exfoliatus]
MSAAAAAAAALPRSRTVSAGGASRRRLRSVPAQAGPVPERVAGHPLSLGRDARARLGGAMRTLLDAAGLDGASDAVRLAVLVLASRTPAEDGVVEIRTPELGRWLGLSASYTASAVVPGLRRSGVVSVETAEGEYGEDVGLACRVLPLWAARGMVGHPLALSKKELATLLRLLEAVMAPGWTHRDGSVTPAGLIGTRTGRGAATDRLALLLLVLEARESGQVRQCGGAVDTKRGRAAATVARLLGCSASAGERVLERLEDRQLVLRVRLRTASKMEHRSRLMVPAVAAAYGRTVADGAQEDRAEDLEPGFSDPDVTAGPSEALDLEMESQVSSVLVGDKAGVAEPDVAAALHTDHSHSVTPVSSSALSGGFSGEGRGSKGRQPGRACVREDQAVDGETDVARSGSPVAGVGPLRGEKPTKSHVDEQEQASGVTAGAAARLTVVGGRKTQQQGRPDLPADLDLRVALAPVSWLWQGLSRWQQDRVVKAVKAELAQLRQVLEWAGQAPLVLAARLTSRLEETGGEALITSPFGWITHRGLVRRPSCSDVRCDDGVRLDTSADCDNCDNVLHFRRAWRVRIEAEVDQELPGLETGARYRKIEARVRRHAEAEAADFVARQADARERATQRAVAGAEAEAQAAVERERAAAEAAARQAVACENCGRERSAALCEACNHRLQVKVLIHEAGLLAATWSADLSNTSAVAAVAAEVRTAIEADIAAEWEQFLQMTDLADLEAAGPDVVEDTAAHNAFLAAESAVAKYRHQALVLLGHSEEAQAEARKAYATERAKPWFQALPDSDDALRAATRAAAQAQARTAEYLLAVRLEQLRAKALPEPVRPAPWSQRLPELAAHSLHGETREVIA